MNQVNDIWTHVLLAAIWPAVIAVAGRLFAIHAKLAELHEVLCDIADLLDDDPDDDGKPEPAPVGPMFDSELDETA